MRQYLFIQRLNFTYRAFSIFGNRTDYCGMQLPVTEIEIKRLVRLGRSQRVAYIIKIVLHIAQQMLLFPIGQFHRFETFPKLVQSTIPMRDIRYQIAAGKANAESKFMPVLAEFVQQSV